MTGHAQDLVQLRIGEDVHDRLRTLKDAVKVPAPEFRPYYGDPRIRIPMDVRLFQENGKLEIVLACTISKPLPEEELLHEVQHHLEKLNMSLSILAAESGGL